MKSPILETLKNLLESDMANVRQTVINTAGEIGMVDFDAVVTFFDKGLLTVITRLEMRSLVPLKK